MKNGLRKGDFEKGMAIVVGRVWHREDKKGLFFVCIDLDKRKAIEEVCTRNQKTISLQELARKFIVEQHRDNPDKAHIYFYSPIPFPKKSADSILGLEVKGSGDHGIVFCSPSIHRDGHPYEIVGTTKPIILNELQARELIQHIDQICIKHGLQYLENVSGIDYELKRMVKRLTINLGSIIIQGKRHVTLISLADTLLFHHLGRKNRTVKDLKYFFDQINEKVCSGPLSEAERDSIWNSALDFVDRIKRKVKYEREAVDEIENEDLVVDVAENLLQNHTLLTMSDTNEIYRYDKQVGMYVSGGEVLIKTEAEKARKNISTYKVNEIINKIRRRTYVNRIAFDSEKNILNLKNGLLNIKTREFIAHTPTYLSLTQLPISYNSKATCPNILRFLGQVLRPKDVFSVLQLFGYCLYRTAKYEKAILCCGSGDNGKSTLLKLFERFLGSENVSHTSIQELNNDRFAIADLHRKLANVCADLKAEKLTNTGTFKMLVSGDTIRGQRKHGQPFDFRNVAKLIFSANEIPESGDQTYAYFKRWIILVFNRLFQGDERDNNLIDRLTTDEELSGLLNLAIIALKQLIKDNGFIHGDDVFTIQREYNQNATVMEDFLNRKCRNDPSDRDNYIICRDIYHSYLAYCRENNKTPVRDNIFGSNLITRGIRKERKIVNGEREYCYMGISCHNDGSIA